MPPSLVEENFSIPEPRDLFEMVSKLYYTVRGSQVEMFDGNQMISTS